MNKISSKLFPFSFFLSDKKPVNNLEESDIKYGGATKNLFTDEMYSNIAGNDYIEVNPVKNTISLFVPDTYNVSEKASQKLIGEVILNCSQKIQSRYHDVPFVEKAIGSWFSEDRQEVVYDNILLLNVHIDNLTITDINFFIQLANYIKREMKQEGVSIAINNALAIV
jgi:hypothetical protein